MPLTTLSILHWFLFSPGDAIVMTGSPLPCRVVYVGPGFVEVWPYNRALERVTNGR